MNDVNGFENTSNKILIADDRPENLNLMFSYLKKFNFEVELCDNGQTALEKAEQINPDLILLEVLMPDMDGYFICKKLKNNPKTKDIPVIFVSVLSGMQDKIEGFESGAVDYITKPINCQEFIARVKTHLRLRNMQKELIKVEKLKSIGILAGGIAHDFNNILAIIMGNLEIIKSTTPHSSEFKIIEQMIVRASELSSYLISFSKGGVPIIKEGDIEKAIRHASQFLLNPSFIKIDINIDPDLWPVAFDEKQMNQVFVNLFVNSEGAMPKGGTIAISITNFELSPDKPSNELLLKEGKYIKIIFKDDGIGIPKENIPMIFDPYFTTREKGVAKGMGLGLSSVYFIVQRHCGAITVVSEINKGTTFTIYLPAYFKESTQSSNVIEKTIIKNINKKILVMDDERLIRDIVKVMIRKLGCDCVAVSDGQKAIEVYDGELKKDSPFDLVILDLTIPGGMGGERTFDSLKKINPNIKAIISSGYSDDDIILNYKNYGFQDILKKPYTFKQLENTLNQVLGS